MCSIFQILLRHFSVSRNNPRNMGAVTIIIIHFLSPITKIMKIYDSVLKIRMCNNTGIHHCNGNILSAKS